MRRWIRSEIAPGVHVVQKICHGDWFMDAIERNVENARAQRKQDAELHGVRPIGIDKRRRQINGARRCADEFREWRNGTRNYRRQVLC